MISRGFITVICALSLGMAACSDDEALNPNDPRVIIAVDNFRFQASNMEDTAATFNYAWDNSGTQATVNQTSTITDGTGTLTIFDADSLQVYTRSLTENGDFETGVGNPGVWQVRVSFADLTGGVSFRLQKKT
jgi:hypothetical protein